ncbi:MAG: hypothetical protein KatS3mg091_231 [Patescibacteria group bacterium]|nr:MAG: hypothetical protein KatS3mg091_231 [Patescibacteria group bacterium]
MKKTYLLISLLVLSVFLFIWLSGFEKKISLNSSSREDFSGIEISGNSQETITSSVRKTKKDNEKRECLLLPYWINPSRGEELSEKEVFYFGIAFDSAGNVLNDSGYNKIQSLDLSVFKKPKIVVRMLDEKVSAKILSDNNLREKAVFSLKEFTTFNEEFYGIVLDLEFSPVFYDFLSENISLFVKELRQMTQEQNLSFEIILFADNFYRQRPYDVAVIADNVDQIWIMAYDFSKKTGLPGPNFPLLGKEVYGYDLVTAVTEFQNSMSEPEKLGVIFGLFGYEWVVDDENRPLNQAKALTAKQINQNYVVNCDANKDCSLREDPLSYEKIIELSNISLPDEPDYVYRKLLYFDDLSTVANKRKKIEQLGVNDFCFWAYGYY